MNVGTSVYRYPGVMPFTTSQKNLFMGRSKDIEDFYQLIYIKQIVVLYGKSGYGKSSLINAGVIPKLIKEFGSNLKYFPIRLYHQQQTFTEGIYNTPLNTLLAATQTTDTLGWMQAFCDTHHQKGMFWYYIKQQQAQNPKAPIFLFFDQFEELFTYNEPAIEEFANELGMVLYQTIPDFFRRKELLGGLSEEQLAFLYEKPQVKLVFSIRADRLSLINRLLKYLPNLLQNCYELDALKDRDALTAIIEPAQLSDAVFTTPRFAFSPTVVEQIISHVKNGRNQKIETTTLQIICRYIEEELVLQQGHTYINEQVLGNINTIFYDYYHATLKKLPTDVVDTISKIIETKFIQNGQRIPFEESYIIQEYKIPKEYLLLLEQSTLLRKEQDSYGRFIYEIGHDSMIEPILKDAQKRLEKEAIEQEFARIQAENEVLKVKRQKLLTKISVVVAIVMIFLTGLSIYSWNIAQKNENTAKIAEKSAKNSEQKAKISEKLAKKNEAKANFALFQFEVEKANRIKIQGDNLKANADEELAKEYYRNAHSILTKANTIYKSFPQKMLYSTNKSTEKINVIKSDSVQSMSMFKQLQEQLKNSL